MIVWQELIWSTGLLAVGGPQRAVRSLLSRMLLAHIHTCHLKCQDLLFCFELTIMLSARASHFWKYLISGFVSNLFVLFLFIWTAQMDGGMTVCISGSTLSAPPCTCWPKNKQLDFSLLCCANANIHQFLLILFGIGSWWQQAKRGSSDVPLPSKSCGVPNGILSCGINIIPPASSEATTCSSNTFQTSVPSWGVGTHRADQWLSRKSGITGVFVVFPTASVTESSFLDFTHLIFKKLFLPSLS